jgi:hypothetical protein
MDFNKIYSLELDSGSGENFRHDTLVLYHSSHLDRAIIRYMGLLCFIILLEVIPSRRKQIVPKHKEVNKIYRLHK